MVSRRKTSGQRTVSAYGEPFRTRQNECCAQRAILATQITLNRRTGFSTLAKTDGRTMETSGAKSTRRKRPDDRQTGPPKSLSQPNSRTGPRPQSTPLRRRRKSQESLRLPGHHRARHPKGAGLDTEKVNYELVTYEGFRAAQGAGHRGVPHRQPQPHRAGNPQHLQRPVRSPAGQRRVFLHHLASSKPRIPIRIAMPKADAIEAGAQEIEPLEAEETPAGQKGARFLTEIKDLDHVSKALKAAGWNVISAEMRYLAKNFPELSEAARKDVVAFLNTLDDHDDVHRVYAAIR